jgi:NAD(P)-dependent dehydrogenase (short-subunit alcohol dehydrogenase family)
MTDIAGKAAVITGGGTGIGMGIAKELARQGVPVAIADIMIDNARRTAGEINAAGGKAIAIACDVCERGSIAAMRDEATAALGPIQLLFANAGATNFERLADIADNDIDWLIQVNLMGVINTVKAFLPGMIVAGGGHVVATASMAGLLPGWIPLHTIYSAAKMGIIGFAMNLAMEVRQHGIAVSTYCPGGVASGIAGRNASYRPEKYGGPRQGKMVIPRESYIDNPVALYAPEAIGPIVLDAVRANHPFIFDHSEHLHEFRETFGSVVEACFGHIADWEREHGAPEVVRVQAG